MIQNADRIVLRLSSTEWMMQSLQMTRIATQSLKQSGHVIICGYGRAGQNLARMLEHEGLSYVALDLDPDRVAAAAAAGESVVFGDAGRRESLLAAGIHRAATIAITYANTPSALRVLHNIHELEPTLPVIVRTVDDADLEKLLAAGATEVIPEIVEGSLMLASHTLVVMGVPMRRVVRRVEEMRDERYALLRGYFHGADDVDDDDGHEQVRLQSVPVDENCGRGGPHAGGTRAVRRGRRSDGDSPARHSRRRAGPVHQAARERHRGAARSARTTGGSRGTAVEASSRGRRRRVIHAGQIDAAGAARAGQRGACAHADRR